MLEKNTKTYKRLFFDFCNNFIKKHDRVFKKSIFTGKILNFSCFIIKKKLFGID